MPHWPEQNATPLTRMWCGLNLLLHVMHHGHSSNQNDSCDYLVRVKAGVEKTSWDANARHRRGNEVMKLHLIGRETYSE